MEALPKPCGANANCAIKLIELEAFNRFCVIRLIGEFSIKESDRVNCYIVSETKPTAGDC